MTLPFGIRVLRGASVNETKYSAKTVEGGCGGRTACGWCKSPRHLNRLRVSGQHRRSGQRTAQRNKREKGIGCIEMNKRAMAHKVRQGNYREAFRMHHWGKRCVGKASGHNLVTKNRAVQQQAATHTHLHTYAFRRCNNQSAPFPAATPMSGRFKNETAFAVVPCRTTPRPSHTHTHTHSQSRLETIHMTLVRSGHYSKLENFVNITRILHGQKRIKSPKKKRRKTPPRRASGREYFKIEKW
ncbi:hypothetical protein TRVL_07553 [Trypanosoma vivax]|nr:hypothetical protein TRVL_07553 [Trypanosoma vivax]